MKLQNILEDKHLFEELQSSLSKSQLPSRFPSSRSANETKSIIWGVREGTQMPDMETESIVRRFGRPVLFIQNDTFETPQSEVWQERLGNARDAIEQTILAVGRVELREHPDFTWVGSAWLVANDIVVTNRHVAREFAQRNGENFVFKRNFQGRTMLARIDFAEEFNQPDQDEYRLTEPLYIEESEGYDIAFFRVQGGVPDAQPIPLSSSVNDGDHIITIGYPAKDSRIPDQSLMSSIYGDIYDVKRMAPGVVINEETYNDLTFISHDCTTLGGNSGSVVLNLDGSGAVGLHFSGSYGKANYAVPAKVVAERLQSL